MLWVGVEIAELNGCHLALYFEARKMKDLYLWAGSVHGAGGVWGRLVACASSPRKWGVAVAPTAQHSQRAR